MLAKTARAGSSGCTRGGNPKTSRNNLCHFGPVRAAKLGDTKNSTFFPKIFQRRFGKYMEGLIQKIVPPRRKNLCKRPVKLWKSDRFSRYICPTYSHFGYYFWITPHMFLLKDLVPKHASSEIHAYLCRRSGTCWGFLHESSTPFVPGNAIQSDVVQLFQHRWFQFIMKFHEVALISGHYWRHQFLRLLRAIIRHHLTIRAIVRLLPAENPGRKYQQHISMSMFLSSNPVTVIRMISLPLQVTTNLR